MLTTNIINSGEIVELIVKGISSASEISSAIKTQYFAASKGVLWNFTFGTNVNLTADEMRQIAKMEKQYANHPRTAYVGLVDLEFGLLRMYQAYANMEDILQEMQVFRSRENAITWLKG